MLKLRTDIGALIVILIAINWVILQNLCVDIYFIFFSVPLFTLMNLIELGILSC